MVDGLRSGLSTTAWLATIMVPTGFLVLLLDLFGVLGPVALLLDPMMRLAGLPGEAALVLATGALVSIYPAIAVMTTIALSGAQMAVLALMVLVCHNLFVETAIQAKVGSNPLRIVLLRVLGALVVGIVMARFLGLDNGSVGVRASAGSIGFPGWQTAAARFSGWVVATGAMVLRVALVVVLLMIGQRLLEYWGLLRRLARWVGPLVAAFGLPRSTTFLWIVANTLGLTFGAAVIIEERNAGHISRREVDLLNHHLAVSHSLLEDTLLFVALGVAPLVLIVPRFLLALLVVWGLRLMQRRALAPRSRR